MRSSPAYLLVPSSRVDWNEARGETAFINGATPSWRELLAARHAGNCRQEEAPVMPEAGPAPDAAAAGHRDLPRYDELPEAAGGGRSAWGLFGATDSVGLLNLQTDASVLAAAGLVRKGL